MPTTVYYFIIDRLKNTRDRSRNFQTQIGQRKVQHNRFLLSADNIACIADSQKKDRKILYGKGNI